MDRALSGVLGTTGEVNCLLICTLMHEPWLFNTRVRLASGALQAPNYVKSKRRCSSSHSHQLPRFQVTFHSSLVVLLCPVLSMATSRKSTVAVLPLLMALWAGSFTSGSHALEFENCLEDKLQAVDLLCEVDGLVREVVGLLPGETVDLNLGGVKHPLSALTIKLKTNPLKVYTALYLDLVGLPLSAKLKIVPEYCGYNNQGLSAQVYKKFLWCFTFKVNICLPPLPAKPIKH